MPEQIIYQEFVFNWSRLEDIYSRRSSGACSLLYKDLPGKAKKLLDELVEQGFDVIVERRRLGPFPKSIIVGSTFRENKILPISAVCRAVSSLDLGGYVAYAGWHSFSYQKTQENLLRNGQYYRWQLNSNNAPDKTSLRT